MSILVCRLGGCAGLVLAEGDAVQERGVVEHVFREVVRDEFDHHVHVFPVTPQHIGDCLP